MKAVPLRIRLTAIFALAIGVVLAAAGCLTLDRFAESQREYVRRADPAQALAGSQAYADLRRELLTALPIVFVVAAAGAYLLAAAALRPVERMRAQAAVRRHRDHPRSAPGRTAQPRRDRPPCATLNDMLELLQAGLDREKRFAADASHELRTPLSMLKTELDLALRRPRSPAELAAALSSAGQETQRLVDLAEDLLLLARTDQADQAGSQPRQGPHRRAGDAAGTGHRPVPRCLPRRELHCALPAGALSSGRAGARGPGDHQVQPRVNP